MKIILLLLLLAPLISKSQDYKSYPMWDPALNIDQRVNDVVSRLTLEEKVSQMLNASPAIPRLGIPAYDWWNEVLHGVARTPFKVTSYPQAIGMAATWDIHSMKTMADQSATEGRAIYKLAVDSGKTDRRYWGLTYWTPNINIFRDPRWGRGQETYGEDPFLTAMLGSAFVSGLQGNDPKYLKAAACAKHFAVHSGPEPSRHSDNFNPSAIDLWNTYLPAFRELIVKANVAGVMCAYNAVNTQPCCANDLLMNEILRNRWKFTGYVTSDCWAVDDFYRYHKTHKDATSSAIDAVMHGTDVECGRTVYQTLTEAVKKGMMAESQLDTSLKRLFKIRYRLGMFDPPSMVKYANTPPTLLEAPAHKKHALKMAEQSIVLLRNENNILPLSKKIKKIAVIGPNADDESVLLGNYNGTPSEVITLLRGIKDKLGPDVTVFYDRAINYTDDSSTNYDALFSKIRDAEVIIYAGGISPRLEGEEMKVKNPGFAGGDRTSILLPAVQTSLLQKLKDLRKPIVFVMMTGSAIAIPWESENIPAIINAWYGGQSGGTAIANVLFGDYNPAGRLPVTFYKSDNDLPAFNDYAMTNRTYRYFTGETLYPFGYGLSYSRFEYKELKTPSVITKYTPLEVTVKLKNDSNRDGEEVVQLYLYYKNQPVKYPLISLRGFQRISLKAGETKTVLFRLSPEQLSYVREDGTYFQPEGPLIISVGGGQPGIKTKSSSKALQNMVTIK